MGEINPFEKLENSCLIKSIEDICKDTKIKVLGVGMKLNWYVIGIILLSNRSHIC